MTSGGRLLRRTFDLLASTRLGVLTMIALALVCAGATVYESLQGTPAAQRDIYQTPWFAALLSLFGASVFASMLERWPFRLAQAGFVLAHVGIVLLLLGSLVSLHFGLDSHLSLSEGEASDILEGLDQSVHVVAPSGAWTSVPLLGRGERRASLPGSRDQVVVASPGPDAPSVQVRLVTPQGDSEAATVGWRETAALTAGATTYRVSYAPSSVAMPFRVALLDFRSDFYPGSRRAATYESQVRVEDPDRGPSEHVVSMNRPLHYRGYTFFQSSFVDGTPQRSILSVSRAPGLPLVYLGTALLTLGIVWMFYVKPALARRLAAQALEAMEARHAPALVPATPAHSARG